MRCSGSFQNSRSDGVVLGSRSAAHRAWTKRMSKSVAAGIYLYHAVDKQGRTIDFLLRPDGAQRPRSRSYARQWTPTVGVTRARSPLTATCRAAEHCGSCAAGERTLAIRQRAHMQIPQQHRRAGSPCHQTQMLRHARSEALRIRSRDDRQGRAGPSHRKRQGALNESSRRSATNHRSTVASYPNCTLSQLRVGNASESAEISPKRAPWKRSNHEDFSQSTRNLAGSQGVGGTHQAGRRCQIHGLARACAGTAVCRAGR